MTAKNKPKISTAKNGRLPVSFIGEKFLQTFFFFFVSLLVIDKPIKFNLIM